MVNWLQVAAGAYILLLTYLLLAPEPLFFLGRTGASIDSAITRTVADWIEHAAVYAVLAGLLLVAFRNSEWSKFVVLFSVIHGFSTEALQNLVPHREGSWRDLLANLVGIGAGILILSATRHVVRSFKRLADNSSAQRIRIV
jgi:VanZ family protein